MAETSFPIKEQPLSDMQWGQVVEGFGSGILARQSEPYGIPSGTIDNAANTIKLGGRSSLTGDGRAVVAGFLHRYDADLTLSVPAVTSATTYYVGLTYDPTQHAAVGGPVKVTVTKSVPSGGGKVYLPIYEIRRNANQLLSDATFSDRRAFIAPQITVRGAAALPPASSVLTFTTAKDWTTGQEWQIDRTGKWTPMGASVYDYGPNSTWDRAIAVISTPLADGRTKYDIDIQMRRTGNTFTLGATYVSAGPAMGEAFRNTTRGIVYAPAMIGGLPGTAALNTGTGDLMLRLNTGTTSVYPDTRVTTQMFWVA